MMREKKTCCKIYFGVLIVLQRQKKRQIPKETKSKNGITYFWEDLDKIATKIIV